MIVYWILLFIPSYFALFHTKAKWKPLVVIYIFLSLTLIIGLRHEVGGDWVSYLRYLEAKSVYFDDPSKAFSFKDPFYVILNWLSVRLGLGIYGVNISCAAIFTIGMLWLCKKSPRPWLALTIAIPYLVLVVSMGYTRQSVGIGILCIAYHQLSKNKVLSFIICTLFAAAFQTTSVIVLPLALPYLTSKKSALAWVVRFGIFALAAIGLFRLVLLSSVERFIDVYFTSGVSSQGALVRITLCIIPSLIFLIFGKRVVIDKAENTIWRWISIFSLLCGLGYFILPSSTVVDRMALYALPIQIYVASRIPDFKIFKLRPQVLNASVVLFAILVQWVWLFYAANASKWLPYQNLLFL